MTIRQSQPDAFTTVMSHVAVGVIATIVARYVIVGILDIRKNSGLYTILVAGGAMWMHTEYDLPVAKALDRLGF